MGNNTLALRIEKALRDTIPTDAMLGDDELAPITAAVIGAIHPHVAATGCGLTFEDFSDQGDEPCVDGGRPLDHPREN